MAAKLLLLLCSLGFSFSYKIIDDDVITPSLTLPTEYHFKAEKIDLIEHFMETLELWSSAEYNRSRIDVDHGMVRRYYYWEFDDSQEGKVYTVSPKSTGLTPNEQACFTKKISEEEQNHDAFPTENYYTYAGTTEHEGREVDVWEDITEEDDVKQENVLYTYKGSRDVDVPVQIVLKYYNIEKGTLDTHIIYNYYNYNPVVCDDDLDAEKEFSCDVTSDDFHGTLKGLHPVFNKDLEVAFNSFKKHHQRDYKDKEEHKTRKRIFHDNWKFVIDHNSRNLGYKLAMNHLSDRTPAEMRRMSGARRSSPPAAPVAFPHSAEEVEEIVRDLPEEFDLRMEGYISPIKNQGNCGSCWAFATTAAVEGALSRLLGRTLILSEQTLLDCAWGDSDGNIGCEGGGTQESLKYVMDRGLPLDEDYGGYLAQNGYCHQENATEVYKIHGFSLATPQSHSAVKVALNKYGPVVALVHVSTAFELYSSGVFNDPACDPDTLDHAMTIVGYGSKAGADYWIVKNSWGEAWGEDGYMLLSTDNNKCMPLEAPYYPIA